MGYLYRLVNTLLLAALILLGLSGLLMLYVDRHPWIFSIHRWVGFSFIFLIPWKSIIVYRSLRRGLNLSLDRSLVLFLSLILALFTILVVVFGLMWMWRMGPYSILLQSLIAWHWILGLALLPFLVIHVLRRWPNPTRADFTSRRSFLKLAGLTSAGVIAGELADRLGTARFGEENGAGDLGSRRFTGSHAAGIYSGNVFPVVGERTPQVDIEDWRLLVNGAVNHPLQLRYADLLNRLPKYSPEILDCTNGWYSLQSWQGALLVDLLEEAGLEVDAAGVRIVSLTGYNHTYPMSEARRILLATHVTGEVLDPSHGFPLRAVVPGRRGWFWVKWVTEVQVLDTAWDVAAGILASPREVLRQWQ
jgi:hypothetical protein